MSRSVIFLIALLCAFHVHANEGVESYQSAYSVSVTLDRLEAELKSRGMHVFVRIDHAAGARQVGKALRPTELLIFGNPRVGTLLMESSQRSGLDLPLKALAWEDSEGQVWLSVNTPEYLATRHGIQDREATVRKMTAVLEKLVQVATKSGN